MVAVVNGSGLGLQTSLGQTRTNVGSSQSGQNPEQIYVNSANGNLIIQDQDEALSRVGADLSLVRTYNSQGLLDDPSANNWRLGVWENLLNLTGAIDTAGSTITKEFGDGSQVVYTYNATLGLYVSALGQGAHDTLSFDSANSRWIWTNGQTRATETYNSSGQIVASTDANGNTSTYGYSSIGLLTSITDVSGQTVNLDYTGNNLTDIRVVSNGQTQTLTHYTYDSSNRLTKVTVDLTPGDNSITDGNAYSTTYTYDGTSTRVATITQSDGTNVSLTYSLIGGEYRVATYTDGDGKVTTFSYNVASQSTANANQSALSTTESTTYPLDFSQLYTGTLTPPVQLDSAGTPTSQLTAAANNLGDGVAAWVQGGAAYASVYDPVAHSWSAAQLVSGSATSVADLSVHTDLTTGKAVVTWLNTATHQIEANRYVISSSTGTLQWHGAEVIATASAAAAGVTGAINDNGTVTVAWRDTSGSTDTVYVSRWNGSWNASEVVASGPSPVLDVSVEVNSADATQVVWRASDGTSDQMFTRGYTTGSGWGNTVQSDNGAGPVSMSAVDTDTNGNQTVVWVQGNNIYGAVGQASSWTPPQLLATTSSPITHLALSASVGSDGAVAWTTSDGNVWVFRDDTQTPVLVGSGTNITDLTVDINSTGRTVVVWRTSDGTVYGNEGIAAQWTGAQSLLSGTDGAAPFVAVNEDGDGIEDDSVLGVVQLFDGAKDSVYSTRLDPTPFYPVQSTDTWASIAQLLYGNSALASQLESALGNPPLVTGEHLMGLPNTLTIEGSQTVPAYYTVQSWDTWTSITQIVYGTTDANAVAALQTALGNPTLTAGEQLTMPATLSFAGGDLSTQTTITDPLGQVSTYSFDARGRLTSVRSPQIGGTTTQVRTDYAYDTDGNILTVTQDPTGNLNRVTTLTYDTNGNLISTRDADGNTVTRTYDVNNQLLTETQYLVPDPDGSGPGQPSNPITTRYVYDGHENLRFVVSGDGRVTEYRYTASGERTSTIQYDGAEYNVGLLSVAASLSEGTLISWVASQDLTKTQRTDYTYDFRGNVSTATAYTATDSTGAGVSGTGLETQYVYDQRGQLLQVINPLGSGTAANAGSSNIPYATTYLYDGLGRVLSTTQWTATGSTSSTVSAYDAADNLVRTTLGNNLVRVATYDHAGHLLSVGESGPGISGTITTSYAYDADGRLRMTTDPDGVRSYIIYDEAGRKVGDIDGTGALTEYFYNNASQVVKTVRYADALAASTLATLVDSNGNPTSVSIATLVAALPTTVGRSFDQITRNVYDAAGLKVYSIDAVGDVTKYVYDGAGRITDQFQYAIPVSIAASVNEVLPSAITISTDSVHDRHTRNFYDNDGNLIGQLDARGYLTQYTYDAVGHLTSKVGYATPSPAANLASGTLSSLVPTSASTDAITYYFYDGAGRQIGEFQSALLDGTGYLTETRYDAAGNVSSVIRYDRTLTYTAGTSTFASLKSVASALGDLPQVTSYQYDGAGRVTQQTDFEGTVTGYSYDAVGNLVSQTVALGQSDVPNDTRTTQKRYDALGRVTQELSGQGSSLITAGMTQAQIDAIWSQYGTTYNYDADGRKISATTNPYDPISGTSTTNRTYYYYDADGRLRFTVDATGAVTETRYNALGERTDQITYAQVLSASQLAGLTGGLLTPTLQGTLTSTANATHDTHESYTYKLTGQIATGTTAEGSYVTHGYDAFGDETSRTEQVDASRTLTHSYQYDQMGNQTVVQWDPSGINRNTTYTYDAFGRVSTATDQYGNETQTKYDRLGRVITTFDAYNNKASTTYDAFSRVLTTTDPLLGSTTYSYTDATRSVTTTTPAGISTTTVHNRNGQTLTVTTSGSGTTPGNTTHYNYDLNGNLTSTSDNLGTLESRAYDSNGREVSSTDARGVITRLTYDAASRVFTSTVDYGGLALTTSYQYNTLGQVTQVTAPGNKVTATVYDRDGRVSTVTVDPTGLNLVTKYTYDNEGDTTTVTEGYGSNNPQVTQYFYDVLGRRTQQIVDPGSGTNPVTGRPYLNLVTNYKYDTNGNLIHKIVVNNDANSTQLSTWYVYDKDNRLTYTIDALGGVTQTTYDADGRVASTTRYANSVALPTGDQATATQATPVTSPGLDRTTQHFYDGDGREVYTIDALGGVTQISYDLNGKVTRTRVIAGTLVTGAYASTAAVTAYLGSVATNLGTSDRVKWTAYDVRGRAVFSVDATGAVTQNQYDAAGNVVAKTEYAALYNTAAGMDAASLQAWASGSGVSGNAQNRTTRYWYDGSGRQVYELDPAGYLTETRYDDVNRKSTTIVYAAGSPSLVIPAAATTSDIKNRANGVVVPTSAADQSTETDYDAAGRVMKVTDATLTHFESYTYDALGNKTSYTNKSGSLWTYKYDAAGNLLEEDSPAVDVTSVSGGGGQLSSSTVHAQIVSRMTYDALGNVITRTEGIKHFSDGSEDASGARVTTYGYDALGRQTSVKLPAVGVYTYSVADETVPSASVTRTDASTPITTHTVYDNLGNEVADQDAGGNWSYKIYDALGRIVYTVDQDNYVTGFGYDSFGNQITLTRYATALSASLAAAVSGSITDLTTTGLGGPITVKGSSTASVGVPTSTQDRTVTKAYDLDNRLKQVTQPQTFNFEPNAGSAGGQTFSVGETTFYKYNAFGQVIRTARLINPNGNAVTDPDINPSANAWAYTFDYYDTRGLQTAEVNADGYLTTYQHNDANGDLTHKIEYALKPSGPVDITGYGTINASNQSTFPNGNAAGYDRETTYQYDLLNRLVTQTQVGVQYTTLSGSAGNQSTATAFGNQVTQYTYDAVSNQTSVTKNGATTYTYYDLLGRTIGIAAPQRDRGDGTLLTPLTLMKRDVYGNLVEQTEYAAGAAGNPTAGGAPPAPAATTPNLDRTTRMWVDVEGHVLQTEQDFDTNAADQIEGTTTEHFASYDARGNLAKEWQIVTNPADANNAATTDALVTIYQYDGRGNQITVIQPQQLGSTNVVSHKRSHYNAFGEIDYQSLDNGTPAVNYYYDTGGRLWLTNQTDGVYRVYLFNLAGQSTGKLEVPEGSSIDLSQQAQQNSPANASAMGGLMRTETRYDAMGNVVEQRLPVYTAPSSLVSVDLTTPTIVSGANGPAYLQWFAPPDSTLQATLYFDTNTSASSFSIVSATESGYTAQASLANLGSGTHTYKILYQRPGDSTVFGIATGTFTINSTTTTSLTINAIGVGSINNVVTTTSGSNAVVTWHGDTYLSSETFEINVGGNWQLYNGSGGEGVGYTVTIPLQSTGTYQYRITDYISGSIEAQATGTMSFTSATSTTSTSGTNSPSAVWYSQGTVTVNGSAVVQGTASVNGTAQPGQTAITNENGQITGYTNSWNGTNSATLNYVSVDPSGEPYTLTLYYYTHAVPSKGIASVLQSRQWFLGTGGSTTGGTFTWNDSATGSGSTWPPGGIDSVAYFQLTNQSGTVVRDSRNTTVVTTVAWAAPADTSYLGWFEYRVAGTSTYTGIQATRSGSQFVVTLPINTAGTYDYLAQTFQTGGNEGVLNLTEAIGQFSSNGSTASKLSQTGTPTYLSGVTASGNTIYWSATPATGDTITVVFTNASTGQNYPVGYSGSGGSYSASFFGLPSGTYSYQIEYTNSSGWNYLLGSGSLSVTTTVTPIPAGVSISPPTNLQTVTGMTDLGNGVFGWGPARNSSSDTVVFKYKAVGATSWANTVTISGALQVNLLQLGLSGAIAYEIDYTASQASQPYRSGMGQISIVQTTNTSGTLSDTTASTLLQQLQQATPTQLQTVDRWGNAISVTSAGQTTTYRYNQFSQLIEKHDPTVSIVAVTPTSSNSASVSTNNNGQPVSYNYYDLDGRMIATRDGDGNLNGQTYNAAGEVVSEQHADGSTKSYVYDTFGDDLQDTVGDYSLANPSGSGTYRTRYAYDQAGRLTDVVQESTAGALNSYALSGATRDLPAFTTTGIVRKTYTYDQAGRRIEETSGESMNGSPSTPETTHYWYDLHGNLNKVETALGVTTERYTYDEQDRKIQQDDANGKRQTWSYDYFGHLQIHGDLGGTTYAYRYDTGHSGLLIQETSTGGSFAGVNKTYSYDAANHLIKIVDAGSDVNRTTLYGYDVYGRIVHMTTQDGSLSPQDDRYDYDALGRIAHISGTGYSVTYSYDAAGNRTNINANYSTSAYAQVKNQNLWYSYDKMNRVLISEGVNTGGTVGIITDNTNNLAQGTILTYDGRGDRLSATSYGQYLSENGQSMTWVNGSTTLTYTYDGMGRLLDTYVPVVNGTQSTLPIEARVYDKASRIITDSTGFIDTNSTLAERIQTNTYNDDGTMAMQATTKQTLASTPFNESVINYAGGYDGIGNVLSYQFTQYNSTGQVAFSGSDQFGYEYGDSYLQTTHTVTDNSGSGPGSTTNTYNVDQQLKQYTDAQKHANNRYFDDNDAGQQLLVVQGDYGSDPSSAFTTALISGSGFFNSANAGYFFFTPDGKSTGTFGQLSGALTANFDVNYQPISSQYPTQAPPTYIAQAGDTLSLIAMRVYGDAKLWYVIAQANGLTDPSAQIVQGTVLTIPNNVVALSNNSNSYKPFDVRLALGNQTPTQPPPPPPSHGGGCGIFGQIIMAIVAIVVAYYLGPLAANLLDSEFAGAVVAAAAASAASQEVGIAIGAQQNFSWTAVAAAAATAGILKGTGLGSVAGGGTTGSFLQDALQGAIDNTVSQGVNIALGLQKSFSWADVAASAVGTGVNQQVAGSIDGSPGTPPPLGSAAQVAGDLFGGVASVGVRLALGGRMTTASILSDVFGNALGDALVGQLPPLTLPTADQLQEVKVTAQRLPDPTSGVNGNPDMFANLFAGVKFPSSAAAATEDLESRMVAAADGGAVDHTVQPGETLSQIAVRFGLGASGAAAIAAENGISLSGLNNIKAGDTLYIPGVNDLNRDQARAEYGTFLQQTNAQTESETESPTQVNLDPNTFAGNTAIRKLLAQQGLTGDQINAQMLWLTDPRQAAQNAISDQNKQSLAIFQANGNRPLPSIGPPTGSGVDVNAKLDKIEASPLGATLSVIGSLFGASEQTQDGLLNTGAMIEGIGMSVTAVGGRTPAFAGAQAPLMLSPADPGAGELTLWTMPPTARGVVIENEAAATDYQGWYRIGQADNGYFPYVDFQKDQTLVSLKSVDTSGSGWMSRMRSHITDLAASAPTIDGQAANLVLDLRVPPGGSSAAQPLINFGQQNGVTVIIKEHQ